MIPQFALGVAEALALQKYPAHVVYGPGLVVQPDNYPTGLIHIERDPAASDALGPPQGSRQVPIYKGVRLVAARATLYMQETLDGARIEDHEDLCEAYVDAFLIAALEWCSRLERGSNPLHVGGMRYLTAAERNHEQVWPGVAYRIQFAINRAVMKVSFDGLTRQVSSMTGDRRIVANRTDVRYAANTTDPPDVNCGG